MTAEEKRKRFWKRIIILVIIWVFVLPIAGVITFGVIGLHREANVRVTPHPKVPDLKGLQIAAAQKTGQQAGFPVEVAGNDIDSTEQPGTVLNQEPWAGEPRPAGTTIAVLVAETNPNDEFWKEQHRIHDDYQRRGFFKDFDRKKR